MDNVIKFPNRKQETKSKNINEDHIKLATEISEHLWNNLISDLAKLNCDLKTDFEEKFPSMILILESIKSLYLQSKGIDHMLQDFAKEAFTISIETINITEGSIVNMNDFYEEIEKAVDNHDD